MPITSIKYLLERKESMSVSQYNADCTRRPDGYVTTLPDGSSDIRLLLVPDTPTAHQMSLNAKLDERKSI